MVSSTVFCSAFLSVLTCSSLAQRNLEPSLICPSNTREEAHYTVTSSGARIGNVLSTEDATERLVEAFRDDTVNSIFINTSGSYFLPSPFNGQLKLVRVFGYVIDLLSVYNFTEEVGLSVLPAASNKLPYIFVLIYRYNAENNTYSLHSPPIETSYVFQPVTITYTSVTIRKGDLIGVLIPGGGCILDQSNVEFCPAKPNVQIDAGKCSTAFFHPMDNAEMPENNIPAGAFQEVLVNLSMEAVITVNEVDSPSKFIIPVSIVVTLFFVILISISCILIWCYFWWSKTRKLKATITSIRKQNIENAYDNPFESSQESDLQKEAKYDVPLSSQEIAEGYSEIAALPSGTGGISNGNYEMAYEKAYEKTYDYANEEPFFQPATEEEGLVSQLSTKLEVTEIPRESLRLHEKLGSGAFGTVYKGVWSHSVDGSNELAAEEVAVKTMEGELTEKNRIKFLQEAAIMAQFKHPYVVSLRGILIEKPMMLVLDLMNGGDLREYLRAVMRENVKTLHPMESSSILLSYMRQIALGMHYFASKSFVHRDLAARNILMSGDGTTCKIADFGLSRDLHEGNYYVSHGGKIPVKWTAPEALNYKKYSTASDVWSYGCILYEMWSLGEKPFQELTNQEAIKHVVAGNRLSPPPGCPKTVYTIMIKCWHPDPEERPTFCDITQELQKSDFHIVKWSADDMNQYSQEIRTLGSPLELGKELFRELQTAYLNTKH